MKLKRVKQNILPTGTALLITKFAWLPTTIAGTTIWLEHYQEMKAYITSEYNLILDGKVANMKVSKWITISKRVIM